MATANTDITKTLCLRHKNKENRKKIKTHPTWCRGLELGGGIGLLELLVGFRLTRAPILFLGGLL